MLSPVTVRAGASTAWLTLSPLRSRPRQREPAQHFPAAFPVPQGVGSGASRASPYLSVLVVNHDVVWLDVSMHDPHTVTVVQRLRTERAPSESLPLRDKAAGSGREPAAARGG